MNKLITSAPAGGPRDGLLRDDTPQFAFVGRSNVGKSSLLNAIMRQNLARTSAAAGKTREANVYETALDSGQGHHASVRAYLVDLPGYGYARGGRDSEAELAAVVEAYFTARGRQRPGAVFLLLDARHPGLTSDIEAHRWLAERVEPPILVATKVDKLSRAERDRNLAAFERAFGQKPLALSSASGEGLDQLRRLMSDIARGIAKA